MPSSRNIPPFLADHVGSFPSKGETIVLGLVIEPAGEGWGDA